jgi:hypothetical protein
MKYDYMQTKNGARKKWGGYAPSPALLSPVLEFLLLLVVCLLSAATAHARTDLFFLAPVSGTVADEVAVPLMVKGERLQAGSFDMLVDTRYTEPITELDNRIILEKGPLAQAHPTYFLMAALQDARYDEGRPYLRTVRVAFAFQSPVNTVGVETLARIRMLLVDRPPEGVVTLPIIRDGARMAEFAAYRQGGGIIVFSGLGQSPNIEITYPENGQRYEQTSVTVNATATDAAGSDFSHIYWADPFQIVEPPNSSPVILEGSSGDLSFSPGLHVLFCAGVDGSGNWAGTWTAFGIQEDILVTILGAISAQVVEAVSGLPVAGAAVVVSQDAHILDTCFTGTDGICLFEGLEQGTYTAEASKQDYERASADVFVPTDQTASVRLEVLALVTPSGDFYKYGVLSVCVTEGTGAGQPVSGAHVREMRGTYSCWTDLSGCCRVARIRQGLDLYWVASTNDLFSKITGPVRLNDTEDELEIHVDPISETGIELEARDTFSLTPLDGLEATIGVGDQEVLSRTTDDAGMARLTPLSTSQSHLMTVSTEPVAGPDGTLWQVSQEITINTAQLSQGMLLPVRLPFLGQQADLRSEAETSTAAYDPNTPTTISLTVTDTAGRPLAQSSVTIRQGGLTAPATLSDASGRVHVTGLLPGEYKIAVRRDGYQGVALDLTVGAGQSLERFVRLVPALATSVTQNVLPYEETDGGVEGSCPAIDITILEPYTGSALSALPVELFRLTDGEVVRTGVTNTTGHYFAPGLAGLPPLALRMINPISSGGVTWREIRELGPLTVLEDQVTRYTFYFSPETTNLQEQPGEVDNSTLVTADIVLIDETGTPLGQTTLEIESLGDGMVFDILTDATGHATFNRDIPGSYSVTVVPSGYQGMEFPMTLGLGHPKAFGLVLPRIPTILRPSYQSCSETGSLGDITSALSVAVRNVSSGLPMNGVTVQVLNPDGGAVLAQGLTGSDGVWTKEGISASRLDIEISRPHPGGWTETQTLAGINLLAGYETSVLFFNLPEYTEVSDSPSPGAGTSATNPEIGLQVFDLYNTPLSSIQVSLKDTTERVIQRGYTDNQGRVKLSNLNPGSYSLEVEDEGRVTMSITGLDLWPGRVFSWTAVLPPSYSPIFGQLKTGGLCSQLRALVLNGQNFLAVPQVSAVIKDPRGNAIDRVPNCTGDNYGRLTIDGIEGAGPALLTLSARSYQTRRIGPIQIQDNRVEYALYTLTRNSALTPLIDADHIPAGLTYCLPTQGQCISQDEDILTIFSYDPVRMEIRRLAQTHLSSRSARILDVSLAPFAPNSFPEQTPYIVSVQEAPTAITLYTYNPGLGQSVVTLKTLQLAGEIHAIARGYDSLAVATSAGMFFYRLTDAEGHIAPSLVSYLNVPSVGLLQSGEGLYALTPDGQILGLDISDLDIPTITGIGPMGYVARHAATAWPYALVADDAGTLHPIKLLAAEPFDNAAPFSNATPRLLASGQDLTLVDKPTGIRAVALGGQYFGLVLTQETITTVELTDNTPLQVASISLPGIPRDTLPVRQRVDDNWSNALMIVTEAGFFTVPLGSNEQNTVNVSIDFTSCVPSIEQDDYHIWTAQGFTDVLTRRTDAYGRQGLFWDAELPAGKYDIALVGPDGKALLQAHNLSLYTDLQGEVSRLVPSLLILQEDRRLSATFLPGNDIWLRLGLETWNPPLCDVHVLVRYRFNTGGETFRWALTPGPDGTFGLSLLDEPAYLAPIPLISAWPATPLTNADLPLLHLPPGGGYGGGGTISVVYTRPGGNPDTEEDVFGKATAAFRVQN